MIKNCLLSGIPYKNYTIKFDTIIEKSWQKTG
jgi:hypothetical protein